jgi:peroxiredoxin
MQRFYASQHTAGRDFAILGVNSVDDVPTARQFIQQHGLTYQILMDSDQSVAGLYHVTDTPTSYFIDRQGVIRSVVIGPVDDSMLQRDVAQISA